ncbi:MAG: FAD:protein FMN transferase [Victivallales bacterium]|nr:FAD:protein FMN transferase [Victivallales bacterium]
MRKEVKAIAIRLLTALGLLCALPALFLFFFSETWSLTRIDREFRVMGGVPLSITFVGDSNEKLERAVEAAYQAVERVDAACNRFNPDSELSRLNATAFDRPFHCAPLLWDILMESKRYYEMTDGEFDISATPFTTLWGFHRRSESLPTSAEIAEAFKRSGLDKVRFDSKERSVEFSVEGMSLDLGGIAKGYAVGLAAETATHMGVMRGVINLSGNAYCFPEPFSGKTAYRVGIKDPLNKSKTRGSFGLLDSSVATSGNYERYIVIKGRHYTHIMNPKTGRPVENMLSVTVVTSRAVDSDALSTSVFIKGAKFAEIVVKKFPRTSILIIKRNLEKKEVETSGFGPIWKGLKSRETVF